MGENRGFLTTHVLNTVTGCPAVGVDLWLERSNGDRVCQTRTNGDGRCDGPLLARADFKRESFALHFATGAYWRSQGLSVGEEAFFERVTLHFVLDGSRSHYHIPLLLSPYAYSTYRGS